MNTESTTTDRAGARPVDTPPSPPRMLDFAALEPGRCYGTHVFALDAGLVADWCRLYGAPVARDTAPAGLVSVIAIRAFMATMPLRPPGGIHAGQRFVVQALPRVGETVRTTLHCAGKQARGGRLWVDLRMHCRGDDGRMLFDGEHSALWAR